MARRRNKEGGINLDYANDLLSMYYLKNSGKYNQ